MTTGTSDARLREMKRVNAEQKEYYEADGGELRQCGNLVTRSWSALRNRVALYRNEIGVKQDMRSLHFSWFGDLAGCHVLELGCASGNAVSRYLAGHAASYLGVDLSSVGVAKLNRMLDEYGLDKGRAISVDFLSSEFREGPFDVVYAQGVLHHFRHFGAFLRVLHSHMSPGGRVIAWDPLQTALIPRAVRAAYRPFQSDADWEWPFKKSTFDEIEECFEIRQIQGMMGWSKWPIALLPFGVSFAAPLGRRLHAINMKSATTRSRSLWRCMNVATLLVRK